MMMLSIIVPVFNKELYIGACIRSILSQTFKAFELILVNDGSTDLSGKICREYAALDSRIILIEQSNSGVSSARNAGIEKAGGIYLGFVDSDDTIEPDMYTLLIDNALKADADISSCRLRMVRNNKLTFTRSGALPKSLNHDTALSEFLQGHLDHNANNRIYHSRILRNIRFEGVIYEDILFVSKAFLNSKIAVVHDVKKYNYIIRSNSVSISSFNKNYLETVAVSAKILQLVILNDEKCLSEAMAFDVMANLSLLNLLLLADSNKFGNTLEKTVNKLNNYSFFIKSSKSVRPKHKYACMLFSISPEAYRYCMYAYCWLTGADVIKRTQTDNA